jgi:F1F0 ATPase subunit 2
MSEVLGQVPALAAGVLLGVFFFGGLWWTVEWGVRSRRPAFVFAGSMLVRTSVTLSGFYLIGRGRWDRLLVCLLGFIIARVVVTSLVRPLKGDPDCPAPEARHAA